MGVAEINERDAVIRILANLYFYGDAASNALSRHIAEDINAQWTIPGGHVILTNKKYSLVFSVSGFYAPTLQQADVNTNDNPLNNYFRIEEYAAGNISFVDGINSNTGYFQLDNLQNNSTTAAHEFGHTLGLVHPAALDIRGAAVPGIMYPRGTITDPHFQYDPMAEPQTKGGTLNPAYRKVLQADIDDLHIERLHFYKNATAVIGDFTSEWHYRHVQEEGNN